MTANTRKSSRTYICYRILGQRENQGKPQICEKKISREILCFQTSGNNFLIILHAQGIYDIDFLLWLVSQVPIVKKLQLIW